MYNWIPLILVLLFLFFIVFVPLMIVRHMFRDQEQSPPQQVTMQDDGEQVIDWYVLQGGKQQLEPPSVSQRPWLSWLSHFTWYQVWQFKHGWNRQEKARAREALDLLLSGYDDEFFEWVRQREENQSGQVIEATIEEIAPNYQPEVQQEEQPLPAPGQWNLVSLRAEGYGAHYQCYALGMLPYLYNHLPQSGTIHRDDNKKEPGLVMGKVISQSQWDDFIGSSNPNAQKGQGLFRRAGLIVDIEREGRKVTVFAHRDIGQAISILTQYLISEQQGQTNKQKDEQSTPHQRREDEEEKSTGDTPHPLPEYQWQEYR